MRNLQKLNLSLILVSVVAVTADTLLTYWALSTGAFVEKNPLGFHLHTIILPYLGYLVVWFATKLLKNTDRFHYIIAFALTCLFLARTRVVLLNILEVMKYAM